MNLTENFEHYQNIHTDNFRFRAISFASLPQQQTLTCEYDRNYNIF